MSCPNPADVRYIPNGIEADGTLNYREDIVPCGSWRGGGTLLCPDHTSQAVARYPQGWRYYPGDVCPHGKYTGGSGIDLMCGYCENGE